MIQSLSVVPSKINLARILFFILLCLTAGTAYFIWSNVSAYYDREAQIKTLETQNAVIRDKIIDAQESENFVPSSSELHALAQRVEWYNERIPESLESVLVFLEIFEDNLSNDVKINDFFYDRDSNSVAVSLQSASEQSLLGTLKNLQQDLSPMSLTLERQLSLDGVDQRLIQYDIRVAK